MFVAASASVFAAKKKAPAAKGAAKVTTIKSLPIGARLPLGGNRFESADGRIISLSQEMGQKGLVVMFSCNTCPYVLKAQGKTKEVMHTAKELRIGMVIVNSNEAQREEDDSKIRMRDYANWQQYIAPYIVDERAQLANAFGATRTPEVFLFSADGKLVYKGALEDNPADPGHSTRHYLVEAMQAVAADKPINPKETKSIGCSIKRVEG